MQNAKKTGIQTETLLVLNGVSPWLQLGFYVWRQRLPFLQLGDTDDSCSVRDSQEPLELFIFADFLHSYYSFCFIAGYSWLTEHLAHDPSGLHLAFFFFLYLPNSINILRYLFNRESIWRHKMHTRQTHLCTTMEPNSASDILARHTISISFSLFQNRCRS